MTKTHNYKLTDLAPLIVGSVALDSIETPFGKVKKALGGAAVYASYSASFFLPVKLVGVVGDDFPLKYLNELRKRPIDLNGLKTAKGKTFHWSGYYGYNLNEAQTKDTQLNVFAGFDPVIPENYRTSKFILLANIDPTLQLKVVKQISSPKFIMADTMNYWIANKKHEFLELLKHVHALVINDAEARQLTGMSNLIQSAKKIMGFGPKIVIIKKGEHGVMLFSEGLSFAVPAYPLEVVNDPTGAGDTFAGGFIGYLACQDSLAHSTLKQAVVFGSVMASFNVEDFSINRLKTLTRAKICKRFSEFKHFTHFDEIDEL